VLNGYPPKIRRKLFVVRELIFKTAAGIPGVGRLEESLKWGEPAYLTTDSGSGSTVRLGWVRSKPTLFAVYFNCNTTLVDTFRTLYPTGLRFEGNRAIVFAEDDELPFADLSACIAASLTYHRDKRRRKHSTLRRRHDSTTAIDQLE
jgi:hypothetical protein